MATQRLIVLDFEATCERNQSLKPQEIIEFPSVLVDLKTESLVDEFQSFVKPVAHPTLTPFCIELTGIQQSDVNDAPSFSEALAAHQAWLEGHQALDDEDTLMLTCGDWDLNVMLPEQCRIAQIDYSGLPSMYHRWVNIKQVFAGLKGTKKGHLGMVGMLRALDLPLRGRHHRGIDDCYNIAYIALALRSLGARFEPTCRQRPRAKERHSRRSS